MSNTFSRRNSFRQVRETPVSVRTDAPFELRGIVIQLAYECGFSPRTLRPVVCQTLRKRPDSNNWSEYPNIDDEIHSLMDGCEWYRVYDVIEALIGIMRATPFSYDADQYESEMNDYFADNGIGWKIVSGTVEVRGDELFEQSIHRAEEQLQSSGYSTATNELREAMHDLSRRPAPDVTGCYSTLNGGDRVRRAHRVWEREGNVGRDTEAA